MASDVRDDTIPDSDGDPLDHDPVDGGPDAERPEVDLGRIASRRLPSPVYDTLEALASLKVTVALFALGIFIVLAGTFAQAQMGNWQAVNKYFRTAFAFIEFDVFAPRSFFPDRPDEPLALPLPFTDSELTGFWFPGGWMIGAGMLMNLLAAHLLRFKVQAKGQRLTAGLATVAFGAALVWIVVALGDNKEGVQDELSDRFLDVLWGTFLGGLVAGLCGSAYGMVRLDRRERSVEWTTMAVVGTILAAVLGYIAYDWWFNELKNVRLKPYQMRILWQLTKGSMASIVVLAGCIMLFKKRGGVVMLHAGVGLIMISELLVGLFAEEAQMQIPIGGTRDWAHDIRTVELAFVDESDPEKDVHVVVPEGLLKEGMTIEHDDLPFTIEVVDYFAHSDVRDLTRAERAERLSDGDVRYRGFATLFDFVEQPPGNGFKEEVDVASVWVDVKAKEGDTLGRYVFTQHGDLLYTQGVVGSQTQPIRADGRTFRGELRFARRYFPYSVHLENLEHSNYHGTKTARDYSSYVQVVDDEHRLQRRVWMNNPLRFRGQTLYQSSIRRERVEDTENGGTKLVDATVLSVVTNQGWMLPYVACMIVAFGMFHQFFVVLMRFLGRERRAREEAPVPTHWTVFLPVTVALLFAVAFTGFMLRPASTDADELSIHEFGRLPVAAQGRLKPFDSLARNTLVQIADRERFHKFTDESDPDRKQRNDVWVTKKSYPAIEWMLDAVTNPPKAAEYPVIRIENLELVADLGLEPRPGFFRYSYDEVATPENEQLLRARRKNASSDEMEWSLEERKSIALHKRLTAYRIVQVSLRDVGSAVLEESVRPESEGGRDRERATKSETEYVYEVLMQGDEYEQFPLAVPGATDEDHWESYGLYAVRSWLKEYAREHELDSLEEIAVRFARDAREDPVFEFFESVARERWVEEEVVRFLAELILTQDPGGDRRAAFRRAAEQVRDPDDRLRPVIERWKTLAENMLDEDPDLAVGITERALAEDVLNRIRRLLGDVDLGAPDRPEFTALRKVFAAHRAGEPVAFDEAIAEYGELLDSEERFDYDRTKIRFEAWFNGFAPFWVGQWLSVFAFLLAVCSWLGARKSLALGGFGLMCFTFVLATLALAGRVYISGRPPVTNLYSSAVFIAWGCILLGLIVEAIYKSGVGTATAGMIGFVSLGVAQFLAREGDTIAVLVAVLDTNIWLATHVVCVTMGYAATFVAGAFALGYVFFGLRGAPFVYAVLFAAMIPFLGEPRYQAILGVLAICSVIYGVRVEQGRAPMKFDRKLAASLTNMTYGTLCFAIFFSFVGTVLGGLWADDSWGRFWGWDPKENGALIIVLWNALVLHARWDGMVRQRGFAILAIAGNITTAWSWFGTNELRAGLHSYGFTDGVLAALGGIVGVHLLLIALASLLPSSCWWSTDEEPAVTA